MSIISSQIVKLCHQQQDQVANCCILGLKTVQSDYTDTQAEFGGCHQSDGRFLASGGRRPVDVKSGYADRGVSHRKMEGHSGWVSALAFDLPSQAPMNISSSTRA